MTSLMNDFLLQSEAEPVLANSLFVLLCVALHFHASWLQLKEQQAEQMKLSTTAVWQRQHKTLTSNCCSFAH